MLKLSDEAKANRPSQLKSRLFKIYKKKKTKRKDKRQPPKSSKNSNLKKSLRKSLNRLKLLEEEENKNLESSHLQKEENLKKLNHPNP